MQITQTTPRKVIVEFDYPDLIELGLDRFIRTGTLYGKSASSIMTEEPFYFVAATEYLKNNDRYIKHAGFPVVIHKEDGPCVLVPLYIASPLYNRRNIWAALPEEIPVGEAKEETVTKIKNALLDQYYELESMKAVLEDTLKNLNSLTKNLKGEALEEIEKRPKEEMPIKINFEMTKDLIMKVLQEITTASRKYDHVLLKIFKRTTGGKTIETINWEKAFTILADNWKLTDKVRKQFIDKAKEVKEVAEKITTVVQTKMVKEKGDFPKKSFLKMAGVLNQIWKGIIFFFKDLISIGRRFLDKLTSLNEALDEIENLII